MSGKQYAVLWMGLILIVLNMDWGALKRIIFTPGQTSGGGTQIPALPQPFIPGTTIPNPLQFMSTPTRNQVSVT